MKSVYVIRKDPFMDSDFVLVCANRLITAKTICNLLEEDFIYPDFHEVVSEMKEREAQNAVYCFCKNPDDDGYGLLVQKVPLEDKPVVFS